MRIKFFLIAPSAVLGLALFSILSLRTVASAQTAQGPEWFKTGTGLSTARLRLAVPEFASRSVDQKAVYATRVFNQVLWNDLDYAGIFELVTKSFYPLKIPQQGSEVNLPAWSDPPVSAQMLVFGYTDVANGNLVVRGRVFDVKNPNSPFVLGKQYVSGLDEASARAVAHHFANDIIQALGGGIAGINLTQIAFVSNRTGSPEIWVMDYDGYHQHRVTGYRALVLTPSWSPDDAKLAFTSYAHGGPQVETYSLLSNRALFFPHYRGLNATPAWSPDGGRIAFCSSMSGDQEIYVSNANGSNLQRLTFSQGVDIAPAWNPKTGDQIAFISDRSGEPQLYMMSSDGTNVQRLITQGGYVDEPSWSPNGLFIAFCWRVIETGTYDIYVIEVASGRIVQLTHNAGTNEHPSWSPDGRHIVFESTRSGSRQIWTMLADGSQPRPLTQQGANWDPAWSN